MTFDALVDDGHEQVTYFSDPETGLRAIIAVHDTSLGPGCGGTRIYDYESEAEALRDALRLSEAMTYKTAAADLDLGGAKAVVLGDPDEIKTEALLEAYGRAVDSLGGRYITAVDLNSTVEDMDVIARETDHVVLTSDKLGPASSITAHGVYHGLRACVEHVYGTDSLDGIDVVVQGIGKAGRPLAAQLVEDGASVTVSDIDERAVEQFTDEYDVEAVAPDAVYEEPCDVFAPCAVGGVINDETIPKLSCDIIAGSANNVLAERRHARDLMERDILYGPDYVLSAGGVTAGAVERAGGDREDAYEQAATIGDRMAQFIERAEEREITVLAAADEYVRERIDAQETPRFTQ
jgi:leucine dehydrogenase